MITFIEKFGEYILKGVMWLWLYLSPAHDYYTTIFLLLCTDIIFGIWKASNQKQEITLKKAIYPFWKKFLGYGFLLAIAVNVDATLTSSWISEQIKVLNIIGVSIVLIELKSILQHVSVLTGTDLWVQVKDKLVDGFKLSSKAAKEPEKKGVDNPDA